MQASLTRNTVSRFTETKLTPHTRTSRSRLTIYSNNFPANDSKISTEAISLKLQTRIFVKRSSEMVMACFRKLERVCCAPHLLRVTSREIQRCTQQLLQSHKLETRKTRLHAVFSLFGSFVTIHEIIRYTHTFNCRFHDIFRPLRRVESRSRIAAQ